MQPALVSGEPQSNSTEESPISSREASGTRMGACLLRGGQYFLWIGLAALGIADRAVRPDQVDGALHEETARMIERCHFLPSIHQQRKRKVVFRLKLGVTSGARRIDSGIATAAFLDWPHAAVVSELNYAPGAKTAVFRRELEGGLLHEVEIQCPAVLTIQLGINTPRYASLRSIKQAAAKPIEVLSLAGLSLSAAAVGGAGSLSRVRRMYVPDKGRAQLIEGDTAQQAKRLAEIIREFKGEAA